MTAWIKANWTKIAIVAGCLLGVTLLYYVTFHHASGSSGGATTMEDSKFLKLLILVFVVSAVVTFIRRKDGEKPYLPYAFVGMAFLACIVALKEHSALFQWAILGLPLFAAMGTYAWMKTDGRLRSFFGFATGVILITWFILFAKSNFSINLDFLGNRIKEDNLIIGLIAIGLISFATWKKSKIWVGIFLLVAACWIGNTVFEKMATRSPISSPTLPQSVKDGGRAVVDGFGNLLSRVGDSLKNSSTPSSSSAGVATTISTLGVPATAPVATASAPAAATPLASTQSVPAVIAAPTAKTSTSRPLPDLDGALLLKGECRSITSGIGFYAYSASGTSSMSYAGDGKNFSPISGNQFEVKSSDINPRIRAIEGGSFTIRKM
jgi:hypothetical protein